MATFVPTTLTKRTGATTTVFSPAVIASNVGRLRAPGTVSGFVPELTLRSVRSGNNSRKTTMRIQIPQVESLGVSVPFLKSLPWGEVNLWIPDGTLQTDVNDLVGYINAATATGVTNLNAILVNGEGVY